jgi:hypothetical protein
MLQIRAHTHILLFTIRTFLLSAVIMPQIRASLASVTAKKADFDASALRLRGHVVAFNDNRTATVTSLDTTDARIDEVGSITLASLN